VMVGEGDLTYFALPPDAKIPVSWPGRA
jgi:hypothetical protein